MERLTDVQQKSVDYMIFLAERTALLLDHDDIEHASGYGKILDEVVESLTQQGLNPLQIALDRIQK